jgi:hypothetical protein
VSLSRLKAFVFWYGAIAQLGERVLCKHEVVGSIPSGSTTLRPSGYAWHGHAGPKGEACPAKLEERRRADRWSPDPIAQNIVRETSLRMRCPSQDALRDF